LKNKLTGQRAQGEMITLRVCDYEELWQHGARDAKTLSAWALYEDLDKQSLIEAERIIIRMRLHTENTVIEGEKSGGVG
jgi:ADP-sugar diphosphatase